MSFCRFVRLFSSVGNENFAWSFGPLADSFEASETIFQLLLRASFMIFINDIYPISFNS